MELIYLTSKKYPGKTADHFFAKEMAVAFGKILGDRFLLILAGDSSDFFRDIDVLNIGLKSEKGRTLYYFFWLFFFIIRNGRNKPETIFFSNDPNLLCDLIILRKIFRFKYRICSEWHQLFDDWRDAFIVKNSDFLVTTSQRLKRNILDRAGIEIGPDRFLVVYGGVSIEKYEGYDGRDLRGELGLPKDKMLAAYIGLFTTLGAKKGIDTMINSLEHLPENVNMVFVGGRKEEIDAYQKEIQDLGLKNRCIFIEKQGTEKVPLYQKAVDILVIPNPDKPPFNNYCIPMKIYEYLASGKPIIYSKLKLLEEVLGDCAFSFVPDDSKDLAEKILSVIHADSQKIMQKTDICHAKAEKFSWENRARGIIDFLGK